jgi:GT2 family glycosyltransferase
MGRSELTSLGACVPTAVLDVDLDALPPTIDGLDERYSRALILLRWRGQAVGRIHLPVQDHRIDRDALLAAVRDSIGWDLWLRWGHDRLAWDAGCAAPGESPRATVAICTRDRTADLRRALDALMRLPDRGQELLVVDNHPSTDDTVRLVRRYPAVRYVREDRAGLDAARNRAVREATHDIVAFTDDDAVVEPAWLDGLCRNFADPEVLCVTGLTMPLELETEAQEWFERHSPFGRGFRRIVFDGQHHNPLVVGRVGAGANMALRRQVVDLVGPFDEALDAGTPTQSGGDHEMFTRILAAGYRIAYDPAALSWHRHRRTFDELRQTLYGYGVGVYATWTRHLLVDRDIGVLRLGLAWFRHDQAPALARALLCRPDSLPLSLVLAELRGCLAGPRAYLASRRRAGVEVA